MMARRYPYRKKCDWLGCNELAINTEFDRRSDYIEYHNKYAGKQTYCMRHNQEEQVLTPERGEVRHSHTYTVVSESYGNFWDGKKGFIYAPGFKAFADEFPAGSRVTLTVTAKYEPPNKDGAK